MRRLSKDLNSNPDNLTVADSLEQNDTRIIKSARLSHVVLLFLVFAVVQAYVLPHSNDSYAVGIASKGAFIIPLIVYLLLAAGYDFLRIFILRAQATKLFRSAESAYLAGDYISALSQYEKCQTKMALTLSNNRTMAYEVRKRIQQIKSLKEVP